MTWNDVTIGQFQMLLQLKEVKDPVEFNVNLARNLLGMSTKEINETPITKFRERLKEIEFLYTTDPSDKLTSTFEIDGQRFNASWLCSDITAGQYIDLTELLKDPQGNLHNIMGVLCLKKGEKYQGFQKYAQLFKDKLSINIAYGLSAFFLKTLEKLHQDMASSLRKQNRKMIKELSRQLRTLSKNTGDGSELLTELAEADLK